MAARIFRLGAVLACLAVPGTREHRWSALLGYNWSVPSRSDIRLHGPGHDLTLFDTRAHDDPSIGGSFPEGIQYILRLEYFFNDCTSATLSLDHMKYILSKQTLLATGEVSESASAEHGGSYDRTPVHIGSPNDLLSDFHHSDGSNYLSVGLRRTMPVFQSLSAVVGAEIGPLILNTDVELFGRRNDKRYHLGGAAADVLFGLRVDWARLLLVGEVKLGRAFVLDALTLPESRAEHAYWLLIGVVGVGVSF